ncbi:hypothetical protein DV711_12730 [Motiliproteus coralliicola]|uniref:Uncharacterized protein n=1 Tax=Motiliproteus coralliicola TaxID=2283196 RepID=A0A369WCI4_9GAMM|nr:hypothetical protein [Motiliproteus coralliicola]RDE19738.1 hypothetical protein DV711_12730 [Motiliproteus coralliicola]
MLQLPGALRMLDIIHNHVLYPFYTLVGVEQMFAFCQRRQTLQMLMLGHRIDFTLMEIADFQAVLVS